MALTTNDVITEDFVRETVEEVLQENLVYRQAFREISATGIQSNSYTFNIDNDDMGSPSVVAEGEEFERDSSSVNQVTVTFKKYGGEVAITMEAMEDGMIDFKAREVEDLARAMAEKLNDEAFTELDNNVDSTVGDSDDVLTFSDIRDGMVAVRQNNYNPDLLIVDLDGYGDLLTDSNFNRATESGDEVVATGEVGQIAGMRVVVDNTRSIGTDEGGSDSDPKAGAFVIDTAHYGYELTRTPVSTNEYEDPERQADIMQIFTRKAWKAIFPEAAVKVDA
ncbi:major head protein [Halogranum tailed virus 1]|uniref:Major capsid protein n=1 Tax=Halogranum tailed virus 1 TaxID=1273749 RepID=R4TME2_9CAUD|nr:major head protein [Halogranum tailed virus 1]AGM11343.1 major capsid protein [Halogranum tailed virus 1]